MLTARLQPRQLRFDFARRTEPGPLDAPGGGWSRRQESIGGVPVLVEAWAYDARCGQSMCAAALEEMLRVERVTSPLRPGSELSRINREAGQRAVSLSAEMYGLVARALELSALTRGAFDIRVAAGPAPAEVRGGLPGDPAPPEPTAGSPRARGVLLDPDRHTLRLDAPDLRIDLGGLALAHAVECAARVLRRRGATHAIVSVGGHTRVLGDRRGRPWSVPFADAAGADGRVRRLALADGCLSIVRERQHGPGDAITRFEADEAAGPLEPSPDHRGPRPGRSVAVRAADGLAAAALAEAMLALGGERGMLLLPALPGAEAVIVEAQGQVRASPGLWDAPASPVPQ